MRQGGQATVQKVPGVQDLTIPFAPDRWELRAPHARNIPAGNCLP